MRHVHLLVLAALVAMVALAVQVGGAAAAGGSVRVTSSSDSGSGSFREAVADANADVSITQIVFVGGLAPIALASPVVYTGDQSLDLVGNGAVLDGQGLVAETDGDLSVVGLTVRNAPGEGLVYEVPADATGTRQVALNGVLIEGNDGHGVLINDQADPEDTSNPDGSDASLDVSVVNSSFVGNGFGSIDRDGLRVNEGGSGSLSIVVRNAQANDNGADGIELDERADGDVVFTVTGTRIAGNGSFDVTETDLDDGMDVDEADDGSLIGSVSTSSANDNFEEGWDFNENNLGDFRVEMTNVTASGNREEGVDFEEDDSFADFPAQAWGGDLVTTLIGVTADENAGGDAGLKIRERADGSITASVRNAEASGNDAAGISVREQEGGSLQTSVEQSLTNANGTDGITVREQNDGDLAARVGQSTSVGNGAVGVRADESGSGTGSLELFKDALEPNPGGPFASNVPVTQS